MKPAIFIPLLFCAAVVASPPADHPAAHDAPVDTAAKQPQAAAQPQAAPAGHEDHGPNFPPRDALARLIDGNDRFRYGESQFLRLDAARRSETFTNGQKPFAAVLACADSRAPVEAIFDQGIGDLFVVRVAGNVADEDEIGTLEYGVAHLGTGLIVVLGHAKCGAVTAVADGAHVQGHVAKLVDNIIPAVAAVKERDPEARGARLLRLSIRANVQQSMHDLLTRSEAVATAVKGGKLQVVGGVYDLQTGAIEWLGEHPRQADLLAGGVKEPANHASAHQDDHAKPAEAGQDVHKSGHDEGHDKPKSGHDDPHDKQADPHDKPAKKPADKHSKATKPRSENWLALGALLGVSAAGSFGTIHFVYGRKPAGE